MSNNIATRQNEAENIDRLAAQRELYSQAKRYLSISLYLSVFIMMALSAFVLFMNSKYQTPSIDLSWILVLMSFSLIIINDIVLLPWMNAKRELAAKIQELFDCDVLQLPWNNMAGDKPPNEIIKLKADKHLSIIENKKELLNWYAKKEILNQVPDTVGKLICQRSNIIWDIILRRRYVNYLVVTFVLVALIPIALGLTLGLSMQAFLLIVVATLMPAFVFFVQQIREHRNSIATLERLLSKLEEIWALSLSTKEVNEIEVRQLQDEIYNHRKTSALIFDWLYEKGKKSQEDSLYYSIEQSIKEYLK